MIETCFGFKRNYSISFAEAAAVGIYTSSTPAAAAAAAAATTTTTTTTNNTTTTTTTTTAGANKQQQQQQQLTSSKQAASQEQTSSKPAANKQQASSKPAANKQQTSSKPAAHQQQASSKSAANQQQTSSSSTSSTSSTSSSSSSHHHHHHNNSNSSSQVFLLRCDNHVTVTTALRHWCRRKQQGALAHRCFKTQSAHSSTLQRHQRPSSQAHTAAALCNAPAPKLPSTPCGGTSAQARARKHAALPTLEQQRHPSAAPAPTLENAHTQLLEVRTLIAHAVC